MDEYSVRVAPNSSMFSGYEYNIDVTPYYQRTYVEAGAPVAT